jgi:D-3-phosphoglycerate dehydrogenase / 2-oxoglutarate reductase
MDAMKKENMVTNLKTVVTDFIEPDLLWEAEQCHEMGMDFKYYQLKTATADELIQVTCDADILVVNMAQIDSDVINGLQSCKLIIRHGIGYDNVDLEAAAQHGIQVVNIPDYCVQEVAEQAVTLITACQRKLLQQSQLLNTSAKTGQWHFDAIHPVYRIAGKTVGIIGFGRIGSTVHRMLKGFDTRFVIADPYISDSRKKEFGIQTSPFEQVLNEADIITVHVPLKWEETYHMFDTPQFEMMKPTAVLVNTSRGGIVNLNSLDLALRQGKLAMAGIDVYEQEPPTAEFPLLNNPNAICTPHLSWLSEESGVSIRHKIMEDIRRFCNGEEQLHPVNSPVLAIGK